MKKAKKIGKINITPKLEKEAELLLKKSMTKKQYKQLKKNDRSRMFLQVNPSTKTFKSVRDYKRKYKIEDYM